MRAVLSSVGSASIRSVCFVALASALALVSACENTPIEPGPDCRPDCLATQTCCETAGGTACVNHMFDSRNCGSCGNVCALGQSCVGGTCTGTALPDGSTLPDAGLRDASTCTASPSCAAGFMCCGPRCIDADGIPSGDGRADMSFNDCGRCGVTCDATTASRCGRTRVMPSGTPQCLCGDSPACGGGTMCLSSGGEFRCRNPLIDPTACGDAAVDCTVNNESCVDGVCTCPATGGSCAPLLCGDTACVDTDTDPLNCGSLGNACAGDELCIGGACSCGTLGRRCAGPGLFGMCGELCCAGACIPVGIGNCGGCGVACTGGNLCMTGAFGGVPACMPEDSFLVIECEEPEPMDAGPAPVDAAMDVDAATDVDAASDVDAGT